jgi:hypothetical protein
MAVVFVLAVIGVVFAYRRDDATPLPGRGERTRQLGVQNPMYAVPRRGDAKPLPGRAERTRQLALQNPTYAVPMARGDGSADMGRTATVTTRFGSVSAIQTSDGQTYAYPTVPTTDGSTSLAVDRMPNVLYGGGTVYAVPMAADEAADEAGATCASTASVATGPSMLYFDVADATLGPMSYSSLSPRQRRDDGGPPPLRKLTREDYTVTAATRDYRQQQQRQQQGEGDRVAGSSGGISRGGKQRSSGAYGFATEPTRAPQISRGGKQRSSGAYGFSGGGSDGDVSGSGGGGSTV